MRRDFKLLAQPLNKIDNFEVFLEALKNLRHLPRLHDQGVLRAAE